MYSVHVIWFVFRQVDDDSCSKPDQGQAIGWAVATFLRHVITDKKHSTVERVQSFVAKDKKKTLMQRKRVGISNTSDRKVLKNKNLVYMYKNKLPKL